MKPQYDTCKAMYANQSVTLVHRLEREGAWETETILTEYTEGLLSYYVLSSMIRHNGQQVYATRYTSAHPSFSATCDDYRIKSPIAVWRKESVSE